MSDIITNLNYSHLKEAMSIVGLRTRYSVIHGTEVPCVIASNNESDFIVYIQQAECLCFQSIVKSTQAGFRDVASHWNINRRFSKTLTHEEGYCLRSESDIKYGITENHLLALIESFNSSVNELFHWVQGPGPKDSLPRPSPGSASR